MCREFYLPMENFHIIPITKLDLDSIKESAQKTRKKYRDRENVKVTTIQNFVAKSLGFKGGFSGYKKEYDDKLIPFMKKNGLLVKKDLLDIEWNHFANIRHQQLAEKLFLLKELPYKLFMPYNIKSYEYDPVEYKGFTSPIYLYYLKKNKNEIQVNMPSQISILEEIINEFKEKIDCDLLKKIFQKHLMMTSFNNLLGNHLFIYKDIYKDIYKIDLIEQSYYINGHSSKEEIEKFNYLIGKLLRIFIVKNENKNSLEIIKYNSNLFFLKGENGEYDFIFKGMKEKLFEHNIYEPYLKNSDIPKSHDTYHFKRWLYFEFKGNLEEAKHNSEKFYYVSGGSARDYPGQEEVLKRYFISNEVYSKPKKEHNNLEDGFQEVNISKQNYAISNLITIKEFSDFLKSNPEYLKYRDETDSDCLNSVNGDANQELPASVSWYDAQAYSAWISKNKHIPVRLLSQDEYFEIFKSMIKEYLLDKIDIEKEKSSLKSLLYDDYIKYKNDFHVIVKLNHLGGYSVNASISFIQFINYMERDSNIIHMKRMDSWKKSNSWYYYEAIKYFNKFKKEFLGEGYLEAYKSFNVFSRFWSKLFRIKKGEGNINELETVYWKIDSGIYVEHPNYMSENNFQKAEFYFHENKLSYTNYKNLDFLLSLNFAEWLSLEGAAVATSRLEAIHGGATPERFRFSASSTGKYKSYKIGFRLCYLLK